MVAQTSTWASTGQTSTYSALILEFDVPKTGYYQMDLFYGVMVESGAIEVYLDGRQLPGYSSASSVVITAPQAVEEPIDAGKMYLGKGTHTLKLVQTRGWYNIISSWRSPRWTRSRRASISRSGR